MDPVRRVLKFHVPVDDHPHVIGRGPVVHAQSQFGRIDEVQVWTLEEGEDDTAEGRLVQAFGTGQHLPGSVGAHIGTVVVHGGHLVWHLFEVTA